MNKYVHCIIGFICLLVGICIGCLINDMPKVSFKRELGLGDISYIFFIVIVGYYVQIALQKQSKAFSAAQQKQSEAFSVAQQKQSEAFSEELQHRDIAFSKKQKLLERLHKECFEAIEFIGNLISENIKNDNSLGDSRKKEVQLKWKIVSQRVERVSKLCNYENIKTLGMDLHNVILCDELVTETQFKYNSQLQKDFVSRSELLKEELDKIVYIN